MSARISKERLIELRNLVAEGGYPSPWTAEEVAEHGGICVRDSRSVSLLGCLNCGENAATYEPQEGRHIAAFDPATVTALLDEIDRLRHYRSLPTDMVWQDYYSPDEVIKIREEFEAEIDRLRAQVSS